MKCNALDCILPLLLLLLLLLPQALLKCQTQTWSQLFDKLASQSALMDPEIYNCHNEEICVYFSKITYKIKDWNKLGKQNPMKYW